MIQFDDSVAAKKISELHHHEEERLIESLAAQQGLGYINLAETTINADALQLLDETVARRAEVAVFARGNTTLSVAIRNPRHPELPAALAELQKTGLTPLLFMASYGSLMLAWERYHEIKTATAEAHGVLDINTASLAQYMSNVTSHLDVASNVATIQRSTDPERVSRLIEAIFGGAVALGASDIHIEPEAMMVRLRYRLDGVLWDVTEVDGSLYKTLISRLKLLAGLKLNVRKEAQDGRFTFDLGNDKKIEVRSSVIPGSFGESIVMRLLDPDASNFRLERLGLNTVLAQVIEEELARPNGAFITTGPTGSGKTTALYAFLQHIHTPQVKTITLEDPIEYKVPGIVQTQVGPDYTFASGLRSILRQDPDVIMVGEVRDHEVAETVVHAALTGHLVFSTLHTNSAAGAFPRLINLGVEPHMVGSAFNIVLGQRLVRVLCPHCKISREANTEEQKIIARVMDQPVALQTIWDAKGCAKCAMSGYKGRIGVFEAIRVDTAVEEAIIKDPREITILQAAKPQGIPSMQQDGIMKVLAGITTIDELERVLDLHNQLPIEASPATPSTSDIPN
jgi:type II secretory ATPase GspE/PulE/Tfp pilus assembly ATPase PilB-like protein